MSLPTVQMDGAKFVQRPSVVQSCHVSFAQRQTVTVSGGADVRKAIWTPE